MGGLKIQTWQAGKILVSSIKLFWKGLRYQWVIQTHIDVDDNEKSYWQCWWRTKGRMWCWWLIEWQLKIAVQKMSTGTEWSKSGKYMQKFWRWCWGGVWKEEIWLSDVKGKPFCFICVIDFQMRKIFQLSDEKGKVGFLARMGIQPPAPNYWWDGGGLSAQV